MNICNKVIFNSIGGGDRLLVTITDTGGPATSAMLNSPGMLAVDSSGNLLVRDGTEQKKYSRGPQDNWSICPNGTIHTGSVKGAVNEFATVHKLRVFSTVSDGPARSWIFSPIEKFIVVVRY